MKKLYFLLLSIMATGMFAQTNVGITGNVDGVYINEIHYDNASGDVGEFVEVAGPAGTDLSTFTITLYNGSSSSLSAYDTVALSGVIANEGGTGFGAILAPISGGIQNGAPDGIALSSSTTTDVQFLSYEGDFTAADGAAMGLASVDIVVSETSTTPIGYSLEYDEAAMAWVVISDDTPGVFAPGMTLSTLEFEAVNFNIFPNPTSNGFVNITTTSNEAINVAVYDVLGKQVINTVLNAQRLNVSSLNAGVYILKLNQNGATTTKKLVIK